MSTEYLPTHLHPDTPFLIKIKNQEHCILHHPIRNKIQKNFDQTIAFCIQGNALEKFCLQIVSHFVGASMCHYFSPLFAVTRLDS